MTILEDYADIAQNDTLLAVHTPFLSKCSLRFETLDNSLRLPQYKGRYWVWVEDVLSRHGKILNLTKIYYESKLLYFCMIDYQAYASIL